MAEHYKFFNSTEQDIREYTAEEFTDYFSRFLSDGVYVKNELMGLRVTIVNGLDIQVETGYALIRGKDYENDTAINFTLDNADNVLDRIDRVVLKLDIVARTIKITLKKGTLGSIPQPPELIDNPSVKELPIAQIRVNKNSTIGIITDERIPVSSLIEIPYEDMVSEFNLWFEARQSSVGVEVYNADVEPPTMVTGDIWLKELE